MSKKKQAGFTVVEGLIIVVVIVAIWAVASWLIGRSLGKEKLAGWTYNDSKNLWENADAPACPDPLKFEYSPIDMSQAWLVGPPGTYRGFNYKVHGGIRLPYERPDGDIDVVAPMDATLIGLVRYTEGDPPEMQYKLDFVNDCGIQFYFDHLYTLSDDLLAVAEQSPEPKHGDTSSNFKVPDFKIKAGEVIATSVGFPQTKNFGFDFGVIDLRQPNEISKNSDWTKIHDEFESTEWFGICWYDLLPGADADRTKELSYVQGNSNFVARRISDYCPDYDYTTLDIEGGKPTEGI